MAQLKRVLSYAVQCGRLDRNPLAAVPLLRKPDVREVVIDEAAFQRLLAAADEALQPLLLVAFDTGMRRGELLNLRWQQVDLKARVIRLGSADTKHHRRGRPAHGGGADGADAARW